MKRKKICSGKFNPVAKFLLTSGQYNSRVVKARKGKGSYRRIKYDTDSTTKYCLA